MEKASESVPQGVITWGEKRGRKLGQFVDYAGNLCTIEDSPKGGVVYVGIAEHRMLLSSEELALLLPVLQQFMGRGKLA